MITASVFELFEKITFWDALYLNVDIQLKGNKLITSIYDNRVCFHFNTIHILHLISAIHISVFRNVFLNSLKSIDKLFLEISDTVNGILGMYNSALNQDYPFNSLIVLIRGFTVDQCYRRTKYAVIYKYYVNVNKHLTKGFIIFIVID